MRSTINFIAVIAAMVAVGATPLAASAKVMKREGTWQLALVPMGPGVMMCAATSHEDATRSVFDYIVVNRRLTAFRISGPLIEKLADTNEGKFVMAVDDQSPVGLIGQKGGAFVVMPIARDSDAKRDFVRSIAAGKQLTVSVLGGETLGRFDLRGADKVLRAFGPCVARLPDRDLPS
ncbi:MAG: hypothetical protein ACJA1L_001279 [Paracoccaceae bacterium]|jgi:hypothetical protein